MEFFLCVLRARYRIQWMFAWLVMGFVAVMFTRRERIGPATLVPDDEWEKFEKKKSIKKVLFMGNRDHTHIV